jgi:hypothetical protein
MGLAAWRTDERADQVNINRMSVNRLHRLWIVGMVRLTDLGEYHVWCGMRARCLNPNCKDYPSYGARGINLPEPWQRDFWAWFRFMGRRPKGFSIERVDNDKGYTPSNVVWADRETQDFNKRSTVIFTGSGEFIRPNGL